MTTRRPLVASGAAAPAGLAALVKLVALVALTGAILAWSCPAGAVGVGGSSPFGLTPVFAPGTRPSSYFQLDVAPGASTTARVRLVDLGKAPETIRLGVSEGVTATNSGSAYDDAFGSCQGAACWISGLVPSVQLSPGQARTLSFSVTVPAGSPPGQYLAGITARPASAGPPVQVGRSGTARASAVIVDEINVGVAITVGGLASLSTDLVVTHVDASVTGTAPPRLLVTVRNDGQRFANGSGTARCTEKGRTWRYPVVVDTLLPGGSAVVPVNAAGLPPGAATACDVALSYAPAGGTAGSTRPATVGTTRWSGRVRLASVEPQRQPPREVAPGVYATIPKPGLPRWALYVMVGGGVLICLLAATLVVLVGRRSHRRARHRTHRGAHSAG